MPRTPVVTLLTDFGHDDPYVGVLKGVITSICEEATLIDFTHGITPHQVVEGAVALDMAYRFCPEDCIHLAVVDPGVGTSRRCIAARAGKWLFVAPDNGVLTLVLQDEPRARIVSLEQRAFQLSAVSRTFAGRDIMAPAAAHLAAGVSLNSLGPEIKDPVMLDLPQPALSDNGIEAHILYIDRYGNCMTNLKEETFLAWSKDKPAGEMSIKAGDSEIDGLSESYADAAADQPLALFASSGRLEIALNQKRASDTLNLSVGDVVNISRR